MLTIATKALVLQALQYLRSDDVHRARAAFKGMSAEEMQKEHGYSGRTRAQALGASGVDKNEEFALDETRNLHSPPIADTTETEKELIA